ncbi:MAG: Nre family DNA repair protein [Candidatus Aenigmatarchaeota archaeon]
MIKGKAVYLNRFYSKMKFKSVEIGESISGASPPAIFVGRHNYPRVFVGPLIPPQHGDTQIMDLPEQWIINGKTVEDVVNFRLCLVRGKETLNVKDVYSKPVQTLQELALAKKSLEVDAEFKKKPRGGFFHEDVPPFGPSAPLKEIKLAENPKWNLQLEKAYYDTDLKARDAMIELYEKGLFVSSIQKALSVGAFGLEKNRKLVPTRWSITAVDDTISLYLLEKMKTYPKLDHYQVYEINTFNNRFVILLMPTEWRYEFLEAFIHVLGKEEVLFSDFEFYQGRKDYASIGGCYYSTRLAIMEKLEEMKMQAGAIVFRESYPGYIPTGVWLVRECVREALRKIPAIFFDMNSALSYISSRLWLPISRYKQQSILLGQNLLSEFVR